MEIYCFVFTYSETQLKVSKSKRAETKETREGVLCYLNVKRGFGGKVEGLNFFFFFFSSYSVMTPQHLPCSGKCQVHGDYSLAVVFLLHFFDLFSVLELMSQGTYYQHNC